jgi:hypothetical protein
MKDKISDKSYIGPRVNQKIDIDLQNFKKSTL